MIPPNKQELIIAEQVVATITHALEEIGYSQVALSYIYDILLEGILTGSEEDVADLLEAMIPNQDIEDTDDENETTTYTN